MNIDSAVWVSREVSEAIAEHLQLFRATKISILQGMDEAAWQRMTPAAQERALQRELKLDGNLHPALWGSPEASCHTHAALGHYQVLLHVCLDCRKGWER